MAASVLCITRDQQFKDTAKRIDISENKLEEILHEYFNDPAIKDKVTYPDDDYILSKVRGKAFLADQNQTELWSLKYSQPIQASTEENANLLKEHLAQFFPKDSIGIKPKQNGTFEVTVGQPLNEKDFLWRGVPGKPFIDNEGNLILQASFDNLFNGYGISFANSRDAAEGYGERSSTRPFIIRINKSFLDSIYPLDKDGGTKALGKRVIGDEYNENSWEERLIMNPKDSIIIPKEMFRIERDPWSSDNMSLPALADFVIHNEALYNVADEMPFGSAVNKVSLQDLKDYREELIRRAGSEEEANYYLALAAMNSRDAGHAGIYYMDLLEKLTPERRAELEDYIDEFYNATGMYPEGMKQSIADIQDQRLKDMYGKENTIYDLLNLFTDKSEYSGIIDLLKSKDSLFAPLFKDIQVKLYEPGSSKDLKQGRAYYNAGDKTIYINAFANYANGNAESVVLHEMMHALTIEKLKANRALRSEFNRIIDEYNKHFHTERYNSKSLNKRLAEHYMEEFVADVWSNPVTIENLKSIKTTNNKTLWDKIKAFFTKLFSGSRGTLMEDASIALNNLLDSTLTSESSGLYFESWSPERAEITEQDKPYIREKIRVGDTIFTQEELNTLSKQLQEFHSKNIPSDAVITLPYREWKQLDMPLEYQEESTLLGMAARWANDWNGERFEYNKKDKTITVPKWWHELMTVIHSNYHTVKKLEPVLSEETIEKKRGEYYSDMGFDALFDVDVIQNLTEYLVYNYGAEFSYSDSRQGTLFDAVGNPREESIAQAVKHTNQRVQSTREKIRPSLQDEFDQTSEQNREINALLNSEVITPTDVSEAALIVSNWISEMLTTYQNNPEVLFENFPSLKTNKWETEEDKQRDIDAVKKLSRKEIIEKIGVDEFLNRAKYSIFGSLQIKKTSIKRQAEFFKNNFKGLMTFASPLISSTEGFVIKTIREEGKEATVESVNDEAPNEGTDPIDKETVEETARDLTEHWAIESRTLDVWKTATQAVRDALQQCYLLEEVRDKDGKAVLDENGNKQYKRVVNKFAQEDRIHALQATQSILHWIQGATNSREMIEKLKEKADNNPWITQIIARLEDRSGKEADFRSQFFKTFYKAWQSYYIQLVRNGKNITMPVNETPALSGVMTLVKTNYNIGKHPLFTNSGIDAKRLAEVEKHIDDFQKVRDNDGFDKINNDETRRNNLAQAIADTSYLLGYAVSLDDVKHTLTKDNFNQMLKALNDMRGVLRRNINDKGYNPFKYGKDSIIGFLRNFLSPLTSILEDIENGSFYANKKMYQGFVTPSYTTKMMAKLGGNQETFDRYILEEFANTEWFVSEMGLSIEQLRTTKQSAIRNLTLQKLVAMTEEERKRFVGHKVLLNYSGKEYMRDMTSSQYVLSVLTEFASETGKSEETAIPAWYIFPIEGGKPSQELFKSFRFIGDNYRETILRGMYMMFNQELSRIQTVRMRNLEKGDPGFIENFDGEDGNGRKFNFLPWMNDYLEGGSKANTDVGREIQKKLRGDAEEIKKNPVREDLIRSAVYADTGDYFGQAVADTIQKYKDIGVYENIKKIENVDSSNNGVDKFLENFVWNHIYAQNSFLQFTVTDIAYYKHSEDLQKRLAQLHSPGLVGDKDATDYDGNSVTDGKYRVFYVEDLEGIKANVVDNLRAYFAQKAAQIENPKAKEAYKAFADSFISNYDNFNVTDGQAFTTMTGLRKKSFINGNWSQELESIWQNFRDGKLNTSDLQTASQVKKNFTYSQITKKSNVDGAPIQTLKVGIQHKDSEALLWMAYGIIGDTDTGRPNILRAIMRTMEQSHSKVFDPEQKTWRDALDAEGKPRVVQTGLDTMIFHSGVKTGYMKGLNFNKFLEDPHGEAKAMAEMRKLFDANSPYGWNPLYVHEVAVEDVAEQLEVPAHFRDHENIWGSQERFIIPSAVETTFMGNDVVYNIKTPDGERQLNAKQFQQEYERVASQNIQDSIDDVCEELGLNQYYTTKEDRNYALSRILRREILSSPRYGSDLLIACSIDENTGDFRIPLGDPVQSKRVEQLINSIVKNRVNKQQFKGGPSVLVTNWGRTKRLNIVFRDKEGNLMPVRSEWEKNNPGGNYDTYLADNQASVAWYECYASATTQDLLKNFMDRDGFIDIESIEMLENGEELLKMIGYRIPTEDMYSIAPFRIVGFLPKEVGDVFMQPWEMPAITGEDHDVDKKNLLRKELYITRSTEYRDESGKENYKKLKADILKQLPELQTLSGDKLVSEFLSGDRRQPATTEEMKKIKRAYLNLMFKVTEPGVHFVNEDIIADGETRTEKRDARNNHIFNMTWGLLTNQASTEKILNTGSFEPQKNLAYKVAAYKANPNMSWGEVDAMKTEDVKKKAFSKKYLPNFLTQTDYYENNSVAGNVLGQAAVQRIAHAILKNNGYGIVLPDGYEFSIAGQKFSGFAPIDNEFAYSNVIDGLSNLSETIGKTLGNHVGAAADAVKDPVLNYLNINTNTFRTYAVMLRLGVPFRVAGLMLSSKAMDEALAEHKKRSLSRSVRLSKVIDETLANIEKTYGLDDSQLRTEDLSFEELIDGLRTTGDAAEDARLAYKILTHWRDFEAMASAAQPLTVATRYNSIASAVGPQVIDNKMQDYKADQANNADSAYKLVRPVTNPDGTVNYGNEVGTQDVLEHHPILKSFAEAYNIADELLRGMPAQSAGFALTLAVIPSGLKDTIMRDRGLLLDLSDFYQSYLLVKSGVVNPSNLDYFVNQFPKEFLESGIKEKYANNPFINAIKPNTRGNKAGRETLVLNIETSGMDTSEVDRIKLGWAQFHKQEPEWSRRLFEYNFAIAGIGYSPKTFMNCLPTQVKELIPGYINTFRNFPDINVSDAQMVVDQFIRNNWGDTKLAPFIKLSNVKPVGVVGRRTITTNQSEFENTSYFRTNIAGKDVLFKLDNITGSRDSRQFNFVEAAPLGDNGTYLEISNHDIVTPLRGGTDEASTIPPRGEDNGVADTTSTPQTKRPSISDINRNIMELRQILKDSNGKPIVGEAFYERVRRGEYSNQRVAYQMAKSLADTLNKKGVRADAKTIDEIRKRFC